MSIQHKDLNGQELHQPMPVGPDAEKTTSPVVGDWYLATDTEKLYVCIDEGIWREYGSDSSSIQDSAGETKVETEQSAGENKVRITTAGAQRAVFDTDGLKLEEGVSVKKLSTDGTLSGNSDNVVPTEKAVKTYADGKTGKFESSMLHIQDQKASGTEGGTPTAGSWVSRVLNTVIINEISGASLNSNQVTLPAGTYYIEASSPAWMTDTHKIKLRNITDNSDVLIGTSEGPYQATGSSQTRSFVTGRFTIASQKTFEIQHRVAYSQGNRGLGWPCNYSVIEIYSDVKIWKL